RPLHRGLHRGAEIVAVIYAGTKGYLDKVAIKDVGRWEAGLLSHMRGAGKDVLDWITREDPKIKGDAEEKLKAAVDDYAKTFS
ncbi:MAG: hypothetical protein AAF366_22380, partial [Pseudomonadota bacterium]